MMDPLAALLDEVSLEGLDGVTLETLWLRLSTRRPAFPLQLDLRVQQYLWNVLACSPDVTFHLLPRARAPLHLYDRFSDIDPETGIQDVRPLDTKAQLEDPYPVSVLVDDPQGVQGSCPYYRERKDITHLVRTSQHTPVLTLEQAQKKYGEKLVIVASQEFRYRALIGDEGNPELKLSDFSYCILERLGRARWQGEIQRDLHISSFKLDAGKVHYLRKSLDRNGLITMQSHVVRLPTGVRQHSILLLLKRFHVDRRSKYDILMESTSNLLSELPNNIGIMLRLREQLQVGEHTFKRVYQYMQAAKMVSVLTIPLQELNPEAGPCKTKRGTDIRVRCLKLLRPYTRKETYDDDDDENNDEEGDGPVKRNVQAQARDIERDLLTQAYEIVVATGPKGISQSVLRGRLNIGKLESRMVCKVLERNNMIKGFMEDEGRQRTTKYISKLFVEKSNLNLRFAKERERSEKLRVPKNDSTDDRNRPCPDPEDQDDTLRNDPETEQDPQEEEEEEGEEAHKGQRSKRKAGKKSKSTKKGSQRASTPRHSTPLRKKPPPRIKETDQSLQEAEPSETGKGDDTLVVPQDHTPSIPLSQSETADDTVTVVEEVVDELEMSAKKRGHEQHETYRMLKRKNLIIEAVRSLKVIEGLYTLQKKLMDEEKQDGVSTKVCKKSIVRLTRSLSRDGYLKLFRTTVIQDGVSRKVEFVVHPSITPDDPLVKSAIEQVRFKISSSYTVHRLKKEEEKAKALAQDSKDELQSESKSHRGKTEKQMDVKELKDFKPTIVPGLSRSLGFQPKMPRFRMVHTFLFYLLNEHPFRQTDSNDPSLTTDPTVTITADPEGNPATPSPSTERDGNTENPPTPAEDEQFKVYVNELSWKRFVPPLPVHREFGYGWALTSDVLISLPLSIYVQVIQINYKVDGLEEFLNDPVKQHYLIRFLPSNIKTQLLHRRKYFFSFYENLQKLCYMGLLQFGPMEKFMDKDQGFFYLKKHATIVDTTMCEPHYNLAIETRPFDRRHYTFNTAQDVENYWFDMLCVCLNTPLGVVRPRSRLSDGDGDREGDEPDVAVGAERYERLQYTLKGSCDVVDDGVTPGDGQGAGGLDSSFFSHLKRNWLWTTHLVSKPKKPGDSHTVRLRNLLSKHPLPKSVCAAIQGGVGGGTVAPPAVQEDEVQMDVEPGSRNLQVRGGKKNKRKRQKKESSKPAKKKRKVVSVRKHTLCQDETDRKALLRMTRQRVTWTHLEDSILMLCRVASHFLNRKIKKTFVAWNVVRDILHSELELSLDKTSLSVGRRSRYIMKNPQTQLNYRICLAEVYQDKALIETFMNRTNNYDDPKVCAEEFNEFVSALRTKFSSSYGSSDVVIPDTKEELFNKFKVYVIGEEPAPRTKDVLSSVEDIHSLVLNNLIQSTLVLSNSQMKTCQSFQSFSLYSRYNSEVLQQAFLNCKKRGLVNRRRANKVLGPKKSRAVPFVPMSYQLSQHYYRYFTWRFPSTVYNEVYDLLEVLRQKVGVDRPNTFSFQQDKEKEGQKDVEEKEEERVNEESEKAEERNDRLEKAEGPGAGVERQQQEVPGVDPITLPGDVEHPAVDPKESPGDVEHPAVDPKESPGHVEHPAVDPKESPGDVEHPAVDPKESPGDVEHPAVDPKESLGDVDDPAVDPESPPGGEDSTVDPALPSGNLREPVLDPLAPPGDVEDSTVDSLVPPTDVEDMLTFPIDAPGGASLCCLSLMTLGLLTVDVSIPQQVVVVDSTLVDNDVVKSITKELDEEEEDEVDDERRGRFEVKARQASHTNYLLMRGYFVPGIISLRNMNSTDHIAVNSCTVKIQLRRTPAHTLFREADGALSVVTRLSVPSVPASLSRVFKQRSSASEQSFVDKFVRSLGYSNVDVEAVQALRTAVQKEAEFGIDRLELSRTFSHLEQVEHGRSRTLQQYIQDLIDAEELLEVGALSPRLIYVDSGAPWLLQCPTQVCDELVQAFSIPESLKRRLGFSRPQLDPHGPPAAKRPRRAMKTGTVKSAAVETSTVTSVTIESASSASAKTAASETIEPGPVTMEISTVKSAAVETIPPETTPGLVAMETSSVTEAIAPAGECSAEKVGGARSLPPDPPSSEAGLCDDEGSRSNDSSQNTTQPPAAGEGGDVRSSEEEEVLSFVARPWRIVDGSLNRPVCKGMLEALLLHIMTNPGIPEPALLQHYSGVLQPVIVLDLLQVLMELGCVKKRFTLNRPKASLFSRPSVPEVRGRGEFGVVEDVVAFYEPTVDCSLRLAQMFPHETNWNKWVQLCVR
ncbi:general transcription factor 3C polypeptide 1-like [Colossoma macropomum]|uniref:general transcription factor 3C polypeptide 1-like n=1 Tax=Colossoma macropomum TaxID=42526 RepID=UPI001864234D|nr:general transcription factor 3C polypeptide 1-like [Colossoma macropomum]